GRATPAWCRPGFRTRSAPGSRSSRSRSRPISPSCWSGKASRSTARRPGTWAWATRSRWRRWTMAAGTVTAWPGCWGAGPDRPAGPGQVRLLPPEADEFFRVERIQPAALPLSLAPQVAVLIVLEGRGRLVSEADPIPLARGTTLFVPHGAGTVRLEGDLHLLRCMPPAP